MNKFRNIKKFFLALMILSQIGVVSSTKFPLIKRKGNSQLHQAIIKAHKTNNLRIIFDCKTLSQDLKKINNDGYTPLMLAVALNNTRIVGYLVNKTDSDVNYINHQLNDGWSILMLACVKEDSQIVDILINNKADILFTTSNMDLTILHAAAIGNVTKTIKSILIKLKKLPYKKRINILNKEDVEGDIFLSMLKLQRNNDISDFKDLLDECLDPNVNPDGIQEDDDEEEPETTVE